MKTSRPALGENGISRGWREGREKKVEFQLSRTPDWGPFTVFDTRHVLVSNGSNVRITRFDCHVVYVQQLFVRLHAVIFVSPR